MRVRRLFATTLGTLALAGVLGAGSALAAPTNAKDSFQFQADCANGQTYTLVVNGNGPTPGHIIAGNGENLIPVAIDLTGYDTDGNIVFTEQVSKNGQMTGRQGNLTTCDIHQDLPGEGSISGTAVVMVTPVGQ